MIPGGAVFISPKRPSIVNLYESAIGGNVSFRTFSSVPLGIPNPRRKIVVATSGFRNIGFTNTVVINGVTATPEVELGSYDSFGIYSAIVPSGSSGDITVSSSTNVDTVWLTAFAIYDLRTPNSANFVRSVQGASNPATLNVAPVSPWSAVIGVSSNRATNGTYSWGGLTKNYEGVANAVDCSSASGVFSNGVSSQNFTSSYSGSLDNLKAGIVGWI